MKSPVLQTLPICEQHISTCLAEKLKEGVSEWKLERPGRSIALKSDNAANAVREADPHVHSSQPGVPTHGNNQKGCDLFSAATQLARIFWRRAGDAERTTSMEMFPQSEKLRVLSGRTPQNKYSDPEFRDFLKKCLTKGSGPLHTWIVTAPERIYDHLRDCVQQGTFFSTNRSVFSPDNVDKPHFSEKKILVKERGVKLEKAVLVDFD